MEIYRSVFIMLSPWLTFILLALVAKFLLKSARKRSSAAIAFGAFSQMLLPDPQVEKTIEMVVETKQAIKQNEDNEDTSKEN
jgi:hypothetical protein